LAKSGLFYVSRKGTQAVTVAPNAALKGLLKRYAD